jgi:hypothetical protein
MGVAQQVCFALNDRGVLDGFLSLVRRRWNPELVDSALRAYDQAMTGAWHLVGIESAPHQRWFEFVDEFMARAGLIEKGTASDHPGALQLMIYCRDSHDSMIRYILSKLGLKDLSEIPR